MGQLGKTEFVTTKGKVILSIDPDSSFVQIKMLTHTGVELLELTNTALLSLGNENASMDGMLGWLLLGGAGGKSGRAVLRAPNKDEIIVLDAASGGVRAGGGGIDGNFFLHNAAGKTTLTLSGGTGDIILQNADCAEDFDVAEAEAAEPGTVVVFDGDGRLRPAVEAYDRKVAGVVSGAGDFRPGIVLDRHPDRARRAALALMGKVFCKVDAAHGAIAVGDLLTTSPTPGHAMVASDPARAFGAVVGKALRTHREGRGLVPMLVTLK
ncbi:MAG TPA: hypothetical protein VF173_24215 [Thermoanaerobaculia bacterium]|nr:hypothetical protein [Thermoanaerobaculia bacterium]